MKKFSLIKTASFMVVAFLMMITSSLMIEAVMADSISNVITNAQEVIVKGNVVRAEDVCGIVAEDNIYLIPCDQVDGFNEKMVSIIGMITQEGEVQSIYATSVQTIK
ncbi:MAG: hypothetical protein HQK70_01845 [Desulfamplus sp.]|nr:hypothetical protein [Desulfamplus sp.]